MEREIKFRAWDKLRNKLCNILAVDFVRCNCKIMCDNTSEDTRKRIIYISLNDIELLQYMGVKDKKGKEIYEGDIVEWIYPEYDDYHKGKSKFGNVHGVVYWNDKYCSFSVKQISRDTYKFEKDDIVEEEYELTFYDYDGMQFVWNELEVIGNIYENKECYERELENYKKEN